MRIAAGETIALLFELARDMDCVSLNRGFLVVLGWPWMHLHVRLLLQDFEFEDWDDLCDKLNALATDCNKHRAKTDKRKQRSVFRDVLKAVEVGNWDPGAVAASASALHLCLCPSRRVISSPRPSASGRSA